MSYTSVFSPWRFRTGHGLYSDEDHFAVPIQLFSSEIQPDVVLDPFRLSLTQIRERCDALNNRTMKHLLPGIKIGLMGFKFPSPDAVLEYVEQFASIETARWDFLEMRDHPFQEYPSTKHTYAVYFQSNVEDAGILRFATESSTWKEKFSYISLIADKSFIWHAVSDSELLRLTILAVHLEEDHRKYLHYPSDWRQAVVETTEILEAYADQKTRHKVSLLLSVRGLERLATEITILETEQRAANASTGADENED